MDRSRTKLRKRRIRLKITLLTIFFIFLSFSAFFFVYHHNQLSTYSSKITRYFSSLTTWIFEHKNYLREDVVKVKQFALGKDEMEPIHFEFYTSLPAMQIALSQSIKQAQPIKQATPAIFSVHPEEMAKEFSNRARSQYIIQLGLFKNPSRASLYRDHLSLKGLPTRIVKMAREKQQTFRVQVGPFFNKVQVNKQVRQLRAKGVNGFVLKAKDFS